MNPKYLLTILVTLLTLATLPVSLRAADSPGQCEVSAPADAKTILRQIELKVAMAQYEKVLAAIYDAQLTIRLPDANATTAEERDKALEREALRIRILEDQRERLRAEILQLVPSTNEGAAKGQPEKAK